MSVPVPVLLTFLVLSACQGHTLQQSSAVGSARALLQNSTFLKESITLLSKLLEAKVSCDKMNVTNIFSGDKKDNDMEILCKATTVIWESQTCHVYLKGLHLNLFSLVRKTSPVHKPFPAPCPVAAGNTTSLNNFLVDLRRFLQRIVKD